MMITPESVSSPAVQEALAGVKFSLFCVDEAHCVSQWGHDFRPSYLGLRRAAQVLGRPPILGLTATATPAIGDDVLVQLGMKDAKVCRVSFHRPNLAFDVRKVAGEADKLRQLGQADSAAAAPGHRLLRHGARRRRAVRGASPRQDPGRALQRQDDDRRAREGAGVVHAARAQGRDAGDQRVRPGHRQARHPLHHPLPDARLARGVRAGGGARGPRRQAGALRAAVPAGRHRRSRNTSSKRRTRPRRRRAWWPRGSTPGATRARKSRCATWPCRWRFPSAACASSCRCWKRWASPRRSRRRAGRASSRAPRASRSTRPRSVFEARRISDRRRLAALLAYMNTQRCRVQMLRAYFGEPEGDKCGLCDSCAGLDSEVFDPGEDDARHGLHAATDFHARPRRRRRGRPGYEAPAHAAPRPRSPRAPPAPVFETAIPTDVLPPLPEFEVPPPPEGADTFDEAVWMATGDALGRGAGGRGGDRPGRRLGGATAAGGRGRRGGAAQHRRRAAARRRQRRGALDRRARRQHPAVPDWRPAAPVALPVLTVRPSSNGQPQRPPHGSTTRRSTPATTASRAAGAPGSTAKARTTAVVVVAAVAVAAAVRGGGRRRRGRDRDQRRGGGEFNRNRDRGPRLPGFYNPGGD